MDTLLNPQAVEPARRPAVRILPRTSHNGPSLRYRLLTGLQQSLDPRTVLSRFFEELANAHLLDGLEFVHAGEGVRETIGRQARASHVFCLHGLHATSGELTLYRQWPFTREDVIAMQSYVVLLQNPLRNALQYQRALAASMLDPLTGIGNRNALAATLRQELAAAERYGQAMSLAIIDLDKFKIINDHHGHSAGDRVLESVARVLGNALRTADICFRFGGEEFVVVLKSTDREGAMAIGDRLRQRLERAVIHHEGRAIRITASIGIASWQEGDSADALFDRADHAMYVAKRAGGNMLRCG